MTHQKQWIWIHEGYDLAAQSGFKSLTVETIARNIGKNKSSFYHYFGDVENFKEVMLNHHLKQAGIFSEKIKSCTHIKPDVLHVFVEHKTDVFFHKQLRIHRQDIHYKQCFETAFEMISAAISDKWAMYIGMEHRKLFAHAFFGLIAENFLLKITFESFKREWLEKYLDEISNMLRQMTSDPG